MPASHSPRRAADAPAVEHDGPIGEFERLARGKQDRETLGAEPREQRPVLATNGRLHDEALRLLRGA